MVYLSKSKYCGLWQCPKMAWLRKFKPEEQIIDDSLLARLAAGNEVGDLAMGMFGDYVEVTAYTDGQLDLNKMIKATREEMEKGTEIICEASFEYNGLYCAVDILRWNGSEWDLYEVKSSTHDDKDVYYADVAYQKYVLERCGVRLEREYLICLNRDYVYDGLLDIMDLFRITDITDAVKEEETKIAANLLLAEQLLSCPDEPDIDLSLGCNTPYPCAFWKYCTRALPSPSVFNLYRMPFKTKLALYYSGFVSYETLDNCPKVKNDKQRRQIDFSLHDRGTYVNRDKIREFLSTLSFPLYFLDFETMQPVIPKYPGTRPYDQIPFQYSLHYIEQEGAELKHREFLAESGTDPRRALAEQLCEDIPEDVCVTAYNKAFECTRIRELAAFFPDLREHLLNIESNIKDLLVPFQSGFFYNRAMGGSFSIKSVLPALFPDDPSLDYHNLEGVHNGGEAMNIFPKIQYMPPEEQESARRSLLKYCELDTFAMVKVWEALLEAAKEP